ncbi:hypothetical protein [Fodinicola acaciae]|nr:hypothetical protein [Fodinicola acaciae]
MTTEVVQMFRLPTHRGDRRTVTRETAPRADRQLERVRDRSMIARGIQL